MKHGPVTTFGIAQRRDGTFRFVASAGTVVAGPLLKIGNTTSRVDFGCDPGEWTDAWSATGISHHWALGTGNLLPELRATAELLGIELAEVAAPARNEVLQWLARRQSRTPCGSTRSSCRPGRSATAGPGSRCSRQPGVPRDPYEKVDDAAQVHKYTGVAPVMAAAHPLGQGRRLRGAVRARARTTASRSARSTPMSSRTTTTSWASICNPDPRVRKKALAHLLECVDIMDATGRGT